MIQDKNMSQYSRTIIGNAFDCTSHVRGDVFMSACYPLGNSMGDLWQGSARTRNISSAFLCKDIFS